MYTCIPTQLTKDKLLLHHIDIITKSNIKIDKIDLRTFYWLPELHENPYKSRFISNSNHCSTTILSKHITPGLTAVKDHIIKHNETAFSNSDVNYVFVHQKLFRGHRKVAAAKLSGISSYKYLLSVFLLYTHSCHMILSKQKCCLL